MKTTSILLFLTLAFIAHVHGNDPGFVLVAAIAAVLAIGNVVTVEPRHDLRANSKWWRG